MDYSATLKYLDQVQRRGIKLGLENITRLLEDMGDPQTAFPAVVVAGTNGKGSVSAFLASILRSAGHRTGLYTSPHLIRYEERIVVDGSPVTPDELASALTVVKERVEPLLDRGELASHPTHFEVLTAAAFHYFRESRVDVAVLEVGMGGRLDAVAAASPLVVVITNVGLEHTKWLGSTIEEIAREKAGVIRPGCRVLTGEASPSALDVIRAEALRHGCPLVERHREAEIGPSPAASSGRFGLTTRRARYGDLISPLPGRHQVENAVLAVLAAEQLADAGFGAGPIPPPVIAEGIARTQWPGRLQVVGDRPLIMLDGAHNPAGAAALARALKDLRESGGFERLCVIFGVLDDKDTEAMLQPLLKLEPRMIVTRGLSPRFRDPDEVVTVARRLGCQPMIAEGPAAALEAARSWASPSDAICVSGSLYLVGETLEALDLEPFG